MNWNQFWQAPIRAEISKIQKEVLDYSDSIFSGGAASSDDKIIELKGLEAYRDIMRDDEAKKCIKLRLSFMLPGLRFAPPGDSEEAIKSAALINGIMTRMRGATLTTFRELLKESLVTGLLIAEEVQEIITLPDFGDVIGLREIKRRPSESFQDNIKLDKHGNVLEIKQGTGSGSELCPLDRIIYYTFDGDSARPYGLSIFNACYNAWKLKRHVFRQFAVYLDSAASGVKTAIIKADQFTKHEAQALRILERLSHNTSIAIPDSIKLEIKQIAGTSGTHFIRAIEEVCNKAIRKAILYTETVGAEGQKTGSYASKYVDQEDVHEAMASEGYSFCEDAITEQVCRRLLDWNGFSNWPTPLAIPEPEAKRDADPVPVLDALTKAVQGGVINPALITEPIQEQIIRGLLNPAGIEYKTSEEQGESQKKSQAAAVIAAAAPPGRRRSDIIRMKNEAVAAEKTATDELNNTWSEVLPKMKNKLYRALFAKDGPVATQNYTNLRIAVEDNIKTDAKALNDTMTEILVERWDSGIKDAQSMLPVSAAAGLSISQAKQVLRNRVHEGLKGQYAQMESQVYYLLENALKDPPLSEIEIKSQLNNFFRDHGLAIATATFVGTGLAQSYNDARMSVFGPLQDADGISPETIIGYNVAVIVDEATTDTCLEWVGAFVRADDPNLPQPPLHYRCRTVLIPVYAGEEPWGGAQWATSADAKEKSALIPEGFGGV